MARPTLTHVVRITLDAAHNPVAASVTTYEDEAVTYSVDPLVGPFDTLCDVLAAVTSSLDRQLSLWSDR